MKLTVAADKRKTAVLVILVSVCVLSCFGALATVHLSTDWSSYFRPLGLVSLFLLLSLSLCLSSSYYSKYSLKSTGHTHTYWINYTQQHLGLVWPSVECGAAILHKNALNPPAKLQLAQTNLLSKWFVPWLFFAVFPQIKRGDLIISWQINRRRPQKAVGSSFWVRILMLEWMRALFYLTHFFLI